VKNERENEREREREDQREREGERTRGKSRKKDKNRHDRGGNGNERKSIWQKTRLRDKQKKRVQQDREPERGSSRKQDVIAKTWMKKIKHAGGRGPTETRQLCWE